MNWLLTLDEQLFYAINHGLQHPWLDGIMPIFWEGKWWVLAMLPLCIYLLTKGGRRGRGTVLLVFLAVGLTDSFSAKILKPAVNRVRPCFDLPDARLPHGFPGGHLSFPSNHAANSAAAAVAVAYRSLPLGLPLCGLSLVVAFSRVYLGVHYPLDVLAGAFLGWYLATVMWLIQRLVLQWFPGPARGTS